ncbi:MAG: formyltetrahydrofolate deformylase [Candidatus Thioglobus sp.]|jgi:formyltetrahydrofolate deformylase|uniref:formyltetrahydrofolate deformylase n=1 Tax=Candidatus Thioglobus sp. TaxID=2026721 RepID=UPI001EB96DA5|nr:formyltetrahydrofolate deformylase [Candidatus Thioglobus sp.]MBT3186534.1 formyltetrahydrofolate deformylase [Candidatus Thioglobus sp.]MBT3432063.1 formyltetrahydrofolate deformylase [Candidatus Thioglobus sp.]MBT5783554.1 formyltetrahydrofolate deformylase [Candidatus Thioglobus sp.]MBT6655174.1 formyltetrahydrofolate deformylase [Candidatus Thioglobus sp.]MBT7411584.1 formyltetrahydrofolate deformylase [Candidatus Thioglobus sp.]
MNVYRLLISCPDAHGLVAKVSQFIFEYDGNIKEAHHHLDDENKRFFMRIEIESSSLNCSLDKFHRAFVSVADKYKMDWRMSDASQLKRILIMGSKSSHCVADLLHRHHEKELEGEIVGVLSNHDKLSKLASWYDVLFKQVSINDSTKTADIASMTQAISAFNPDVIVLARYMQIIPGDLCDKYSGKIINIHHSFLPSFVGANPYARAAERGVKLIGATCHYVTANLDEGPIIEQDVVRVNHADSADDMKKMGQDIEKITLAKGLQYHLEDRVLTCNNKTVVFS